MKPSDHDLFYVDLTNLIFYAFIQLFLTNKREWGKLNPFFLNSIRIYYGMKIDYNKNMKVKSQFSSLSLFFPSDAVFR